MLKGPVAMMSLFSMAEALGRMEVAVISVVVVIGGPASPIKMPNPKQAKKAIKTITNSRLFME